MSIDTDARPLVVDWIESDVSDGVFMLLTLCLVDDLATADIVDVSASALRPSE